VLKLSDFEFALQTSPVEKKAETLLTGVSIDSRTLKRGNAFFAIRGKKFDGHNFLKEAKQKGASAFVVDKKSWRKITSLVDQNVFVVEDTTIALGKLAACFRRKHNVRAIGIAGSCGKTTTKQISNLLLSRKYRVLATAGNLNNQFGLPLTIFRLHPEDEILLAEIGASQTGDIGYLCGILGPEIGLITNIYPAHLEGFGSLEKIYEAKLELASSLEKVNGTLIVNGDNHELVNRAKTFRVRTVTFGREKSNDFFISRFASVNGAIEFELNGRYGFSFKTHALFNLDNFLAAIALAHEMKVPFERLEGCLEDLQSLSGRFELHILPREITAIHDAYNANPGSVMQSLVSFSGWSDLGRRKIVVLSDMKELGAESSEWHRRLGREFKQFNLPILITVGEQAREIAEGAIECHGCEEVYSFSSSEKTLPFLFSFLRSGDAILLKGSRATKLEDILFGLKSELTRESTEAFSKR